MIEIVEFSTGKIINAYREAYQLRESNLFIRWFLRIVLVIHCFYIVGFILMVLVYLKII